MWKCSSNIGHTEEKLASSAESEAESGREGSGELLQRWKTAAPASINPGPRCASENLGQLRLSQVAQASQTLLCNVLTFWTKCQASPFPAHFSEVHPPAQNSSDILVGWTGSGGCVNNNNKAKLAPWRATDPTLFGIWAFHEGLLSLTSEQEQTNEEDSKWTNDKKWSRATKALFRKSKRGKSL